MLVLSRKAGERISIGPEIEVTVLGIHKGRVKLGFSSPPEVPIHREELRRRMGPDQARQLAARSRKARDIA
ncbi:MAG: carbon storage regulator [Pirellulaceae bacterium]